MNDNQAKKEFLSAVREIAGEKNWKIVRDDGKIHDNRRSGTDKRRYITFDLGRCFYRPKSNVN